MPTPVSDRQTRPPDDAYGFWAWVCLLPMVLPLWAFKLLPCTDLPQHLAMSAIMWRLLQQDGPTRALFELNLQPIPYYMLYVVLVPLVGLFGALLAAKLLLTGLAVAWVEAMRRCLRAVAAPAVLLLAVPTVFFGPMFYWGFVATLVGIPGVLLCLAGLLQLQREAALEGGRLSRKTLLGTCLAALWATLAHALLALPCGMFGLIFFGVTPKRRKTLWATAAVLASAGLPLVPALWGMAQNHRATSALQNFHWVVADIHVQWTYVKQHLGPFDHGIGRGAHQALLLLLLGICFLAHRQARQQLAPQYAAVPPEALQVNKRLIGTSLLVLLAAYALTPRRLVIGESYGFMLAYRYLSLVELLALIYLVPPLRPRQTDRQLRRQLAVGLMVCCTVYSVAQWRFFAHFNAAAQPRLDLLRSLPAGQWLTVDKQAQGFERAAAPLLHHLTVYYTAETGMAQSDLFSGSHLPIRWRQWRQPDPGRRAVGSQKPTYHLEISKADAATPLGWAVQAVGAPRLGAAEKL